MPLPTHLAGVACVLGMAGPSEVVLADINGLSAAMREEIAAHFSR